MTTTQLLFLRPDRDQIRQNIFVKVNCKETFQNLHLRKRVKYRKRENFKAKSYRFCEMKSWSPGRKSPKRDEKCKKRGNKRQISKNLQDTTGDTDYPRKKAPESYTSPFNKSNLYNKYGKQSHIEIFQKINGRKTYFKGYTESPISVQRNKTQNYLFNPNRLAELTKNYNGGNRIDLKFEAQKTVNAEYGNKENKRCKFLKLWKIAPLIVLYWIGRPKFKLRNNQISAKETPNQSA